MNSNFYQTIGYTFKNENTLKEALTHISLGSGSKSFNYERLEFLGDRVLGFVVAALLFRTFPDESEGQLARRSSNLVRKEALVRVAEQIDLGAFLRLSKGETFSGGRQRPSLLADCTEALLAAIFIDGGIEAAEAFVNKFWAPYIHESHAAEKDAESAIQEWTQARHLALPVYEVVEVKGKGHMPTFKVRLQIKGLKPVEAVGKTKREAEHIAAAKALEQI